MTLAIVIDSDSIAQHPSTAITGIIFWRLNGHSFPDNRWSDYIVVIMDWWVRAMLNLVKGVSSAETMDFMDGPFVLRCTIRHNNVECQFINRRGHERVVASWIGEALYLSEILLAAAQVVLTACRTKGLTSHDVASLENGMMALRSAIASRNAKYENGSKGN